MMSFFAEAGSSCLAMSSLIVFLTVFWLIEVRCATATGFTTFYYMASSASGQDEPNRAL